MLCVTGEGEDELAGAGLLVPFDDTQAEIKRLYVRPGSQGRGIGRALTGGLLDVARTLGYNAVVLDVMPQRCGAIRLYKSFGFEQTAPFRDYEDYEMEFMRLPL